MSETTHRHESSNDQHKLQGFKPCLGDCGLGDVLVELWVGNPGAERYHKGRVLLKIWVLSSQEVGFRAGRRSMMQNPSVNTQTWLKVDATIERRSQTGKKTTAPVDFTELDLSCLFPQRMTWNFREKIHPSYGFFDSGMHLTPVHSQHPFPGSFPTYRASKFLNWLECFWMDTVGLTSELTDP